MAYAKILKQQVSVWELKSKRAGPKHGKPAVPTERSRPHSETGGETASKKDGGLSSPGRKADP